MNRLEGSTGYTNPEMSILSKLVDRLGRLGTDRHWGRNRNANPFGIKPLTVLPNTQMTKPISHVRIVGPVQPQLYDWEQESSELVGKPEQTDDPRQSERVAPAIGAIGIDGINAGDPRTVANYLQEMPSELL